MYHGCTTETRYATLVNEEQYYKRSKAELASRDKNKERI